MMLYNKLRDQALETLRSDNLLLAEAGMGVNFTYVKVTDGKSVATGVSLTPKAEGNLGGMSCSSLEELLNQSSQYDSGKRAFGLAAINAVSQYKLMQHPPQLFEDLRAQLTKFILEKSDSSSKIVFIGHLQPVVKALKAQGRNPVVFCRQHTDIGNEVYSDIYEYEAIQEADILIITGAALIGTTIDALLYFGKKVPIKVLAGFSAGTYPAWLRESGITHVASIYLDGVTHATLLEHSFEYIFTYPCYIEATGEV